MSSTSEDYNPTIEKRGSTLVINEENMRNVPSWSGNVSWSLRIPDGLEVRHNAGGGGVSVAGLRVNLEMNTGSGHFEMTDYEGKVKVNAGSGDVRVTKSKGQFKFNCGSGDITFENVAGGMSFNAGSGNIEAKGVSLTDKSSFNAGSGDVEVALAGAVAHDISVNSGSGDAVLDLPAIRSMAPLKWKQIRQAISKRLLSLIQVKGSTGEEILP